MSWCNGVVWNRSIWLPILDQKLIHPKTDCRYIQQRPPENNQQQSDSSSFINLQNYTWTAQAIIMPSMEGKVWECNRSFLAFQMK